MSDIVYTKAAIDAALAAQAASVSATYVHFDGTGLVQNGTAVAAPGLGGPANALTANGALVGGRPNTVDATSGSLTVTLPTPTVVGQLLAVEKIDSTANTVIVSGTIRGTTSTLTVYWQFEGLLFEAESLTSWRPIAGHKTKASLDAAYAALASPAFTGTPTANGTALAKLTDVPVVLTWDTGTSNYLPAALKASTQPKEFRGPTDPSTVSGVTLHSYDIWAKTGF